MSLCVVCQSKVIVSSKVKEDCFSLETDLVPYDILISFYLYMYILHRAVFHSKSDSYSKKKQSWNMVVLCIIVIYYETWYDLILQFH